MDSRSFDTTAGAHVHLNETARNLAADHALAEVDAIALTVYIELPVTVPLYFRGHHRTDYAAGHRIEAVHPRSEVLMLAYMNEQAFADTLRTGKMHYYSRSRKSQWLKGETSGHFQYVKSLQLDCDNDTILAKVHQIGAACHTGSRSCFFQTLAEKETKETNPLKVFEDVFAVIQDRKIHPKEGSYTNYLFDKGIDKILKKVGEEATEIVIAAKNPDPEEIKYEISDFLYHVMVLMAERGVTWEDITEELANR